jgi:tetratricopeptide (TPR) repeat protein
MRKVFTILVTLLMLAGLAAAQSGYSQQQQPPAQTQTPQPGQQPGAAPGAPPVKRGPQAKTQPEYDAYKAIETMTDLAAAEIAANDFVAKFPDSELVGRLYQELQRKYQDQNNAEKTVEMGRKALEKDPENFFVLVTTATVLAERTRETDLDRNERFAEATKYSNKVIADIDSMVLPPEIPADRAQMAKSVLLSMAHAALGTIELNKENWAASEKHLRESTAVNQGTQDAISWLRLSIALDRQQKYSEGLEAANKALQYSNEPSVTALATQQRDRLQKLASAPSAPTAPATPPPAAGPQPQSPPATQKPPQMQPKEPTTKPQ